MKKTGQGTYATANDVFVNGFAAVVGQKEKEGPLGSCFAYAGDDEYFGQKTFEQAEIAMQREALDHVIKNARISEKNIDFIFAGDLQNQCVGSNYGVRDTGVRYFGVYGACSTMAEALTLSAMAVDGGFAENVLALTSSHFCTAERQYRFPLEYGALRPPTSQWTVTGAGCVALGSSGAPGAPRLTRFTPGRVIDRKVKDMNNMGAAMAPAAADTLLTFFHDTGEDPRAFDGIFTGDLGSVGHALLRDLLSEAGLSLGDRLFDCGMMIYDPQKQDVHAGGSGCGCGASVLCAVLLPRLSAKRYKRILFVATGALMNPTVSLQGETVPAVAHLCELCAGEGV